MSITQSLLARAEASNPVRVGVIGAGEMGTDIVTQLSLMPGMQLAVLAEVRAESAAIHADRHRTPAEGKCPRLQQAR